MVVTPWLLRNSYDYVAVDSCALQVAQKRITSSTINPRSRVQGMNQRQYYYLPAYRDPHSLRY